MLDQSTNSKQRTQFGIKALFFWTTFLASAMLAVGNTTPMTLLTMGATHLALLGIAQRISPESILCCGLLWFAILARAVLLQDGMSIKQLITIN